MKKDNAITGSTAIIDFATFLLSCEKVPVKKPEKFKFDVNNKEELDKVVNETIDNLIKQGIKITKEVSYKDISDGLTRVSNETDNFAKKVYHNICVGNSKEPGKDLISDEDTCLYSRKDFDVIELSEKGLKEQLLGQLTSFKETAVFRRNGRSFKDTFQEALEIISLEIAIEFGCPDICIKLSKTDYVVGDISAVCLYTFPCFRGAFIVKNLPVFRLFRIGK